MPKKKSETRKHTAMVRMSEATRDRASKAASLMNMTLADYVDGIVSKAAERDLTREAKKIAGEGG